MKWMLACAVVALASGACKGNKKDQETKASELDAAPTAPLEGNARAVELLRKVIEDRYSHRDRLGLDWDALFAKYRDRLVAAADASAFGKLTAELLEAAKDTHIVVSVGDVVIPTFKAPLRFNIDAKLIAKRVKGIQDFGGCLAVGTLDDKTGYLLLKGFRSDRCPRFGAAFKAAWKEIGSLPQMVIDARGNSGGDETYGRLVAARFVEGDQVYALTELGPPRNGTAQFPRRIMGAPEAQRYTGEVRLLIGHGNLSSAESFILMMKQGPRVKTLGAKTYGSSGNPKGVILGNGVTVNLPSWRGFTADGAAIEGIGVAPDTIVEWPKETKADVIIDAALASF